MGRVSFTKILLQGTAFAVMMPSRQAIVPEIVTKENLLNAISLSSAGGNLSRVAAPAIGGLLVGIIGVAAETAAGVVVGVGTGTGNGFEDTTAVGVTVGVSVTVSAGAGAGAARAGAVASDWGSLKAMANIEKPGVFA